MTPISERDARRIVLAVLLAGVAIFLQLYLTQGLLPQIGSELGAEPSVAGLTVAGCTMALGISLIPMSMLAQRLGAVRTMTVGVTVAGVLTLALAWTDSIWWMIALRVLQGICLAAVPATALGFLGDALPPARAVAAVGVYLAGNTVGGLSSRLVSGALAEVIGWRWSLTAMGIFSVLVAVAFRLLLPRVRTNAERPRGSLRQTLSDRVLRPYFLLAALCMVTFGASYTMLGYRLHEEPYRLGEAGVGAFYLLYLVGTVVTARTGAIVARWGRHRPLVLAGLVGALGALITLAPPLVTIAIGMALVTGGFFLGHGLASSSVNLLATHDKALASAVYLTLYYLANSLGIEAAAVIYHGLAWPGVAVFCILAMLGVAATGVVLLRRDRRLT